MTAAADGFTRQFPLQACNFKPNGGNAFFNLKPGRQLYLSNVRCVGEEECDELEEVWITVLPETRLVEFSQGGRSYAVRTRVVQEFETADGEGNPEDDAWLAGVDGARPGIIMPDRAFLLGSKYYQEQAPAAQDRARHTALGLEIEVPAGLFRNCVEVTETSPLEPGEESIKVYCPNVGLVMDEELELIAVYDNADPPVTED